MSKYVRRVVIVALVLGTFTQFTLSLRADELDLAKTRLAKCTDVAQPVLDAIATKLNPKAEKGVLAYGRTVQAKDLPGQPWFVSAQLRKPGRPRAAPGDILTWVTAASPEAPAADYRAVDLNAKKFADWPAADDAINIRLDPAIDSRACVHESRPGTKGLFH